MTAQRKSTAPRGRRKASAPGRPNVPNVREWVGRDVSEDFRPRRFPFRFSLPLVLVGMAAGLALVVLRIDVIRTRYALSEATAKEHQLREEQRRITVQMRKFRAPGQLVEMAREEGFVQPERILELEVQKLTDHGGVKP